MPLRKLNQVKLNVAPLLCRDCEIGNRTVCAAVKRFNADGLCNARLEIKSLSTGQTLIREGSASSEVHILHDGWAFRYVRLSDGRRQILSFAVPGDVLIPERLFFANFPVAYSIQALTPASLCVFPMPALSNLLPPPSPPNQIFQGEIFQHTTWLQTQLVNIGRRSAEGRLAQLLLDIYGRLEKRKIAGNGRFDFPASQEHIADALGLTTVYVNRLIDGFRKGGILAWSRPRIEIMEPGKLRTLAEEM